MQILHLYMDLLMWGEGRHVKMKTWSLLDLRLLLPAGGFFPFMTRGGFLVWRRAKQNAEPLWLQEERADERLSYYTFPPFVVHYYTTMMTQNTLHSALPPPLHLTSSFSQSSLLLLLQNRHSIQTTLSKRYHIFQKILLLSSCFEHTIYKI